MAQFVQPQPQGDTGAVMQMVRNRQMEREAQRAMQEKRQQQMMQALMMLLSQLTPADVGGNVAEGGKVAPTIARETGRAMGSGLAGSAMSSAAYPLYMQLLEKGF